MILSVSAFCLLLIFVIFKIIQRTGKDKIRLKNAIGLNKAKDEILEFKRNEKDFIHNTSASMFARLLSKIKARK